MSKTFGARTILRGLDFEVDERARVGVIGPNGGGKSTMLRLLAGSEHVGQYDAVFCMEVMEHVVDTPLVRAR